MAVTINETIINVTEGITITVLGRVSILVVAGGSGGSLGDGANGRGGGGGGAGGAIYKASHSINFGNYPIVIGAGGGSGTNGANTTFDSYTMIGGGHGGGSNSYDAAAGGSGGGAGALGSGSTNTTVGAGTSGQGYSGGQSGGSTNRGGGGGGATGAGENSNYSSAAGGLGLTTSISGASVTYATGGIGGYTVLATDEANNTGNGGRGGAGNYANISGGAGGSGIVIIAYPLDGSMGISSSSTGGTITQSGGNQIHTFTTNGTFVAVPTNSGMDTITVTESVQIAVSLPSPLNDTITVKESILIRLKDTVNILAVGGGASAGGPYSFGGGGGGAGQLVHDMSNPLSKGQNIYPIIIGQGGTSVGYGAQGLNGTTTTFLSISAIGGGGGGYGIFNSVGNTGASGGGSGNGSTPGTGTAGYNGGTGSAGGYASGGGGGATSAGGAYTAPFLGGDGGLGLNLNITGSYVIYSNGGYGGGYSANAGNGAGGSGGGYTQAGGNAVTPGSGGGGSGYGSGAASGSGANGIVVIRFNTADYPITFGGTKTIIGDETIHTFTTSGSFTVGNAFSASDVVTVTDVPSILIKNTVDFLLVGAGGAGGDGVTSYVGGGGGGAGGALYNTAVSVTEQVYTVSIGNYVTNSSGQNSVFGSYTAYGGGVGGSGEGAAGSSGGSGGGGSSTWTAPSGGVGGAGTAGQGTSGGTAAPYIGGGGGAAGGGLSLSSSISGSSVNYAFPGPGGTSFGTSGANATYIGSGGGGSREDGSGTSVSPGQGKEGALIIRYKTAALSSTTSGGTKTTNGEYTIHTYYVAGSSSFFPVYNGNIMIPEAVTVTESVTMKIVNKIELLMVAGGGKGGTAGTFTIAGGGGAGGGEVYYSTSQYIGQGTFAIVIGNGSQDTTFNSLTATSGGAGGNAYQGAGGYGGNGGGGGGDYYNGQRGAGGSAKAGGYAGLGAGTGGTGVGGCGGGGAGGFGSGNTGGVGRDIVFAGEAAVTYGKGGTASVATESFGASGGANTGDGGGGSYGGLTQTGGTGGSGIVKIAYPTGDFNATGGTITYANGNTIHTFLSNGNFIVSPIENLSEDVTITENIKLSIPLPISVVENISVSENFTSFQSFYSVFSNVTVTDVISIFVPSVLNPTNVYAEDGSFATLTGALNGQLDVSISIDGGVSYSALISRVFTDTNEFRIYGEGSTELWGYALNGASINDTNLRVKISHNNGYQVINQVYRDFGFDLGEQNILSGFQIQMDAEYDPALSVIKIDNMKAKIHYGTSVLPIKEGSQAYASDGMKSFETNVGTGVLVYYDSTGNWRACDTGLIVASNVRYLPSAIFQGITITEHVTMVRV